MDNKNIKINHLLLILGVIILIVPPIIILPSWSKYFDFSLSGQIGDTIGGITAPLINAIGAVLVFVAFKEQIKANNLIQEQQYLIQEQQYFEHIQTQIHRLEDDFLNLSDIIHKINTGLRNSRDVTNNFKSGRQFFYTTDKNALNKAIYSTTIFELTLNMIEKSVHNQEFLLKKIRTLYLILYRDNYLQLREILEGLSEMNSTTKLEEAELLFQINKLQENIDIA